MPQKDPRGPLALSAVSTGTAVGIALAGVVALIVLVGAGVILSAGWQGVHVMMASAVLAF